MAGTFFRRGASAALKRQLKTVNDNMTNTMSLREPAPREWFEKWRQPGEFYDTANVGLGYLYNTSKKFSPPQYLCGALQARSLAYGKIIRDHPRCVLWACNKNPQTLSCVSEMSA